VKVIAYTLLEDQHTFINGIEKSFNCIDDTGSISEKSHIVPLFVKAKVKS
jgi:hypothetical protein